MSKKGKPRRPLSSRLGATGRYPKGKLNEDDEGELELAVGARNGSVIIVFGKSIKWIGMGPDGAEELAELLKTRAKEAREQQH